LTHEEVLAQGLLFFLAGFETTANTLSLLGYSLATNPEKQEKLLKEIDEVMKDKVSQTNQTTAVSQGREVVYYWPTLICRLKSNLLFIAHIQKCFDFVGHVYNLSVVPLPPS